MNLQKHIKILKELLSEKGISAVFNYNIKKYGMEGVYNIEQLFDFIEKDKFDVRSAVYLAFYWDCDKKNDRGFLYWHKISTEYKRRIENGKTC